MIKFVIVMGLGFGLIFSSVTQHDQIKYFQTPTISLIDTGNVRRVLINDSVYVVKAYDVPLYYYTILNTGVCFDDKCRPLSIDIYWNITGRYLGFELPDEEFLSKTDHEPFTNTEYLQLDSLLANPFLPLGNYSFYDLVDASSDGDPEVDGVSGATAQEVRDYLVPGAAYTTYKLWNVVYGPVQDEVIQATEKQFDEFLFTKILKSSISADRIWAAERVKLLENLSNETADMVIEFIREGEYSESYILLQSITPKHLDSEYLQVKLFQLIGKTDYSLENQILDKLKGVNQLTSTINIISITQLKVWSDMQLVNVLKLLMHHDLSHQELRSELEKVFDSKNPFVQSQITKFLGSNP